MHAPKNGVSIPLTVPRTPLERGSGGLTRQQNLCPHSIFVGDGIDTGAADWRLTHAADKANDSFSDAGDSTMKQPSSPRFRSSTRRLNRIEQLEPRCMMAAEIQLAEAGQADNSTSLQNPATSSEATSSTDLVAAEVIQQPRDWRIDSALIAAVVQGSPRPASRTESPSTFPRGSRSPSARPYSMPIGLFPDGSVRTIHPDIDPAVLELLQQGGRAPIPSTTHRPGVGYGAPTNTVAGIDPRLRLLVDMTVNWGHGSGPLIHSRHAITIQPDSHSYGAQQIFQWLNNFEQFSHRNIARATLINAGPLDPPALAGHRYVIFHPRTLPDVAANDAIYGMLNTAQRMANPPDVAVRLFSNPEEGFVMGVTLGNHMLVGARRWTVTELVSGELRVETDAWVRCNGELNRIAMQYGGQHMMSVIWRRYLANIGNASTQHGGSWRWTANRITVHPDLRKNPFRVLATRMSWVPQLLPEAPDYLAP